MDWENIFVCMLWHWPGMKLQEQIPMCAYTTHLATMCSFQSSSRFRGNHEIPLKCEVKASRWFFFFFKPCRSSEGRCRASLQWNKGGGFPLLPESPDSVSLIFLFHERGHKRGYLALKLRLRATWLSQEIFGLKGWGQTKMLFVCVFCFVLMDVQEGLHLLN